MTVPAVPQPNDAAWSDQPAIALSCPASNRRTGSGRPADAVVLARRLSLVLTGLPFAATNCRVARDPQGGRSRGLRAIGR